MAAAIARVTMEEAPYIRKVEHTVSAEASASAFDQLERIGKQ